MFDRDEYRDKRIASLMTNVEELRGVLKHSSGSSVVSLEEVEVSTESISKEIKNKSDLIVEFTTDKIDSLTAQFYKAIESNRIEHMVDNRISVAKIAYVLKQQLDFVDSRGKWYVSDEVLAKLRAPVSLSYQNLFRETPTLQPETLDIDFERMLDFQDIKKLLVASGAVKKLPLLYLNGKGLLDNLDRYLVMFDGIKTGLKEQYDTILAVLRVLVNKLSAREEIALTERIDLDKTSTVCLGFTIKPTVYETIQKVWYRSNVSTQLGSSGRNIKVILDEPVSLFNPASNQLPNSAIDNLIHNFNTEETTAKLQQLRRLSIDIADLIKEMSKSLDTLTDMVNEKPHQTNEGFYNYGLEDISVYISEFSISITSLLVMVSDITAAIINADIHLEQFSKRLENHLVVVNTYIQKRKTL